MSSKPPRILALNGGSSSIRFAAYSAGRNPSLTLRGELERIGSFGTRLVANVAGATRPLVHLLTVAERRDTRRFLLDWLGAELKETTWP